MKIPLPLWNEKMIIETSIIAPIYNEECFLDSQFKALKV